MRKVAAGLRRLRGSVVAQNAAALYAVQGAAMLLPMVTLPYLARTLHPDAWGLVVFGQSYAAWIILLLNYGFAFSATRAVAQGRDDAEGVARTVAGVQGAKLLLGLAAAAATVFVGFAVPVFRAHPGHLLFAFLFALGTGFSPLWYFQGVERMRGAAALDVAARVVATAAVFLWVRGPGDGWLVLALQAAAALASCTVATLWMYRRTRFLPPRLHGAAGTLRAGLPLFVFCSAASVYTTANSFLLGLMAAPATVSFYGAGDKLVRAAVTLIYPISQAMYPRINSQVARDRSRADQIVQATLLPIAVFGGVISLVLGLGAPLFVRVLFGAGYVESVGVLRVEAAIPLLVALGTVLGIHWALPLGMDREYNRLVLAAGAAHLLMCVLLVPRLGARGMAWSSVLAECIVEGGLLWLFLRRTVRVAPAPLPSAEPR